MYYVQNNLRFLKKLSLHLLHNFLLVRANSETIHRLFILITRSHYSEYHNNFKAPSDFVYSEGAWKGANPPHLNQVQVWSFDFKKVMRTILEEFSFNFVRLKALI